MRRRSRASGERTKAQRGKPAALKRRNAPKSGFRRLPPAHQETEVARLAHELNEAREQQAATADVLKVISRSTFDLQTVLDTLVESAARLCEADMACIVRPQGSYVQFLATYGFSQAFIEVSTSTPVEAGRWTLSGRVLAEGRTVRIPDVLADPEYTFAAAAQVAGCRSGLGVPLMREGTPVGVMNLWRSEVRPFAQRQIELVTTFADQAVIAIENTRLLSELRQSLEQQTATANVLRVISSSPSDLRPVFDALAENAARLCDGLDAYILLREGNMVHYVARYGDSIPASPGIGGTRRLTREIVIGRAILEARLIHILDLQAESEEFPEGSAVARQNGYRTIIAVPLMRDGVAIGTIVVRRVEARLFSEKQVELVSNFGAQAVIAIENTRLLNELRESLQQQTATADVLRVISSSPGALEPVFQAMLENAVRICEAKFGTLLLSEGDAFRVVAMHNPPPAYAELRQREPIIQSSGTLALARAIDTKRAVQIADATGHPT